MGRLHLFVPLALALASADATTLAQPQPRSQAGSCLHRSGPFAWNCAGPIAGMRCTHIIESADPDAWHDNYFCSTTDIGMSWSSSSPVPGMTCTRIIESADPHTWSDNYLCLPPNATVRFAWSSRGPISGQRCVQWEEPLDTHTWHDNYLCWTPVAPPSPPPQPAATERPDHRCGPSFGGARCGADRCCSAHGWCGSRGEPHCGAERGFAGRFDGP